MKRILILSANPKNTGRLRLDEEMRVIQTALEQSSMAQQFEVMCYELDLEKRPPGLVYDLWAPER